MSVECIRDCVCVCCVHIPGLCQIYKITQINQSENKTKCFEKIQKSNLALKIFKLFFSFVLFTKPGDAGQFCMCDPEVPEGGEDGVVVVGPAEVVLVVVDGHRLHLTTSKHIFSSQSLVS